jgi:thioredoxin 2
MADALNIVCPHCDRSIVCRANGYASAPSAGPAIGRCTRGAVLNSAARFYKHANHSDIPLLVDFWVDGADLRTGGNRTRA